MAGSAEADFAPERLAAANINPTTRLATDYLNHFNTVVMLLEMISSMPECAEEILAWRPASYPDYFAASHFRERDLAVAAWHSADPRLLAAFSAVVAELDEAMAEAQRLVSCEDLADRGTGLAIGELVAHRLKPLISEASGIVNGRPGALAALADGDVQDKVDRLFP